MRVRGRHHHDDAADVRHVVSVVRDGRVLRGHDGGHRRLRQCALPTDGMHGEHAVFGGMGVREWAVLLGVL